MKNGVRGLGSVGQGFMSFPCPKIRWSKKFKSLGASLARDRAVAYEVGQLDTLKCRG